MTKYFDPELNRDEIAGVIERSLKPIFGAFSRLLLALADEPHLSDATWAATEEIASQVTALGGVDVGPLP